MSYEPAPLSKTAKYKKITKPLLERKRRARINRCLDELKDLMVGALEIDDDNLSKLEKADILELTVNHLTKLHSPKDPVMEAKKFQAGFGQCAAEACRFIMSVPDLDQKVSQNLISHLSQLITQAQPLTIQVPDRPPFSPPTSPSSVVSDRHHYYSDHDRSSSDAEDSAYSGEGAPKWRKTTPNTRPSKPTGLLTTVDKLPAPTQYGISESNGPRTSAYFNRVPAEAKDVILQKIRQHIMDKRGNDQNVSMDIGNPAELTIKQNYPERNANAYRMENAYNDYNHYNTVNYPITSDTLDLRKVRSPTKQISEINQSPEKPTAYKSTNQFDNSNYKTEVSLPDRCELPIDYSNLPPKKKRKLIEYQEYKKQEEAKRKMEAFYVEQKGFEDRPPADDVDENKWRPW